MVKILLQAPQEKNNQLLVGEETQKTKPMEFFVSTMRHVVPVEHHAQTLHVEAEAVVEDQL